MDSCSNFCCSRCIGLFCQLNSFVFSLSDKIKQSCFKLAFNGRLQLSIQVFVSLLQQTRDGFNGFQIACFRSMQLQDCCKSSFCQLNSFVFFLSDKIKQLCFKLAFNRQLQLSIQVFVSLLQQTRDGFNGFQIACFRSMQLQDCCKSSFYNVCKIVVRVCFIMYVNSFFVTVYLVVIRLASVQVKIKFSEVSFKKKKKKKKRKKKKKNQKKKKKKNKYKNKEAKRQQMGIQLK
eukprot:TRINITY_DN7092_c0_g1_i5.p1 TRINITY_DN7092_c0_g1~~TRINITY_DN7092_c0_g1_i5.p1  ORF type:complete len:233 (-),score=14.71 TRINITY_DN7092_c0_g1_i5:43-741(-)